MPINDSTRARMAGNIAAGLAGNLVQPSAAEIAEMVNLSVRMADLIVERVKETSQEVVEEVIPETPTPPKAKAKR